MFIERQTGTYSLPLAWARPLLIRGSAVAEPVRVPLATTERGLVACINRGAKVLSEAGGVDVTIYRSVMTRAALFRASSAKEAVAACLTLEQRGIPEDERRKASSEHIRLVGVRGYVVGDWVHVRCGYAVGDAMGGNAVTVLTDRLARFLAEELTIDYVSVSSNLCTDKKPAAINVLEGRGFGLVAEAVIGEDILRKSLRVSSSALQMLIEGKLRLGSSLAGSAYHQNAHVANTLAAMYLPLGQDVAQVVESSMGIMSSEAHENGLRVMLTLPALEVGVLGGGTEWEPAKRHIEALGCLAVGGSPGRGSRRLAEIFGGFALASEVSLLASQAEGTLPRISETLGRAQYEDGDTDND